MTTPKLALPELTVGQAGKELTHNQALAILSQLTQANVVDKDLAAPPASPADGSMYIVATSATGAWLGKDGQLAFWLASVGAWTFSVPQNGWRVWVSDESAYYSRVAGSWVIGADSGAVSSNVVTEATTARALGITDAGAYIRHTNASASTATVTPQASVSWPSNTEIHIRRAGAGNLTLTAGAGVTLNAPSGGTLVMSDRMSVTLKRVAADIWDVIGQTVAA